MTDRLSETPEVPMLSMDTLWLQVAGTLCNIACTHCFISSSPHNTSHPMMTLSQVETCLEEARTLGVRDYYFTGGEPFLHRDILPILETTLAQGPATVLTNGMLLRREICEALRELFDRSEYSLDIRVSLDGFDEESHDSIRGKGSWNRAMWGLRNLAAVGLDPVITVTEAAEEISTREGHTRFLSLIRSFGFLRPRLKVLSLFRIGAEALRSGGYETSARLTNEMMSGGDRSLLQCSSSRMVTGKGVYVCPILIETDEARMGTTISGTLRPFPWHTAPATPAGSTE